MRRTVYLAIIVLGATSGAYLIAGYGQDDRGQWWLRSHLTIIRDQLDGLRNHLRRHKEAHGRYPTNDDGLAVLDNFEARFTVYFYRDPAEPLDSLRSLHRGGYGRFWWQTSRGG